jgi:hypothetical protein
MRLAQLRDHDLFHGRVEIRVGEHDVGRVPAELQRQTLDVLGSAADQQLPDLGRTGERNLAKAPVGKEARQIAIAVSGVASAGLTTLVQPAASAGPSLRVSIAAGKFQGVIAAATPTGWRSTRSRLSARGVGTTCP